jgi:hypothetical protein
MVTIDPKHLIGQIFLKDIKEDRQIFCACLVCAVFDKENEIEKGS